MQWLMVAGVALLGMLGAGPAKAGLLGGTADFAESLDLPGYSTAGARVLSRAGAAIDGSTELTAADTVSNPHPWTSVLNASLGDLVLTLTPDSTNTYQVITFTVSNIVAAGQAITGFVQTGFGAIDAAHSSAYTETVSYTADSLTVSYAVNDLAVGTVFQFSPTGSDSFAVTTAVAVPEPASWILLGSLMSFVSLRRERRGGVGRTAGAYPGRRMSNRESGPIAA